MAVTDSLVAGKMNYTRPHVFIQRWGTHTLRSFVKHFVHLTLEVTHVGLETYATWESSEVASAVWVFVPECQCGVSKGLGPVHSCNWGALWWSSGTILNQILETSFWARQGVGQKIKLGGR
jgi:hypothetical protein